MPSIDIINKRLQDFLSIKSKVKDLNCITENLYDRAKNISNSFSNDQQSGTLFGKLFSIKDNINIKGYSTTCASKILKNHKSVYNATVISRIEKAGGLIVAKTNLDDGLQRTVEFYKNNKQWWEKFLWMKELWEQK